MSGARDRRAGAAALVRGLVAARNPDGGWGYARDRASRLEPTSWALIAIDDPDVRAEGVGLLTGWIDGRNLLREPPGTALNVGFNGLAVLALLAIRSVTGASDLALRVGEGLSAVKGIALPPSSVSRQDNSLRAWPWVEGTFSWVEPTACCLLALKKLYATPPAHVESRLKEAERLLLDRTCDGGGWNYGSVRVYGASLPPFVATTALALLALQDRPELPVVDAGLGVLERRALDEPSGLALGLTSLCLDVFGRPRSAIQAALDAMVESALDFGNIVTMAAMAYALDETYDARAVRV